MKFRNSTALWALGLSLICATGAMAAPFTFGVMSDTQWIGTDDGYNPGSVAVDIIQQLNQEFINKHVKFVIQVGDLSDSGGAVNEDFRAIFAQPLYNNNIAFFPLRGNHESSKTGGLEDVRIYPQTVSGYMNVTPTDLFSLTNADAARQPFPAVNGSTFTLGSNFQTPDPSVTGNNDWRGLTYSFDYENVRFVLLDQFTPLSAATGSNNNPFSNAIDLQQGWIDGVLGGKPANGHAFVFSHKGLITENHVDTLFGSNPSADPTGQNAFISSLYNHGVRYYMNGHDHMHDRALVSVTSGLPTDAGTAKVQNITAASDSSKFYIPANPSNDTKYNVPTFGHSRQAQLSQELNTVGYYIFNVDGPKVNVDYYSAVVNPSYSSGEYLLSASSGSATRFTPTMNFVKRESFGYSLNGKEFLVAQNASYSAVNDSYAGTTAAILSGVNGSQAHDSVNRAYLKTVNTGWTDKSAGLASDSLTLWGMTDLGQTNTDTYTLSLSYDDALFKNGFFRLATKAGNAWNNAISGNNGGAAKFVVGPYTAAYTLGTYGVDPATKTAWAVINHASDFAVAPVNTTEVSAQVSITVSGTTLNRATKLSTGTVTIKNTGTTDIPTPVFAALNGLTQGVTLANALGTTAAGAPYTTVTNSGLAAGASITIPVSFSNPTNTKINYTAAAFAE